MKAELNESIGKRSPLTLQCVLEGIGWIVHDGEQFIHWPPVPHWLKHLQVMTNYGPGLVNVFIDPAGISDSANRADRSTEDVTHYHTGRRSPASWCIHWKIRASIESRVCSSPSCTQHQCWFSSTVCSSSGHPSTCSAAQPWLKSQSQLQSVLISLSRSQL